MTELADTLLLQLTALRAARVSGVRRVDIEGGGGRRVTEFKSDKEIAAAIFDLEKRIAALGGKPIRTIRFQTSKGAL